MYCKIATNYCYKSIPYMPSHVYKEARYLPNMPMITHHAPSASHSVFLARKSTRMDSFSQINTKEKWRTVYRNSGRCYGVWCRGVMSSWRCAYACEKPWQDTIVSVDIFRVVSVDIVSVVSVNIVSVIIISVDNDTWLVCDSSSGRTAMGEGKRHYPQNYPQKTRLQSAWLG